MQSVGARWNVAVKAMLVSLIAASLAFGSAERFRDKAMGARAVAYPLLCSLPLAVRLIAGRKRATRSYPHVADALITSAFVADLAGNALNLFDTVTWFDKAAHFTNCSQSADVISACSTIRHSRHISISNPIHAQFEVPENAGGIGAPSDSNCSGSAVLRGDLSKHATDTVSEAGQVIRGGCDEHIKVDGPVAPCTIRFRILTGAIHATPG